jgi:prepilin-type N-terminal cleavage/methylation domain-containing protein
MKTNASARAIHNRVKRSWQGFTLVELIMVMVVLASIMAVSAPSLNQFFKHSTLNDEARRMVGLLEMARREAISNGFPMQVWFDIENQWFGIRELSGTGSGVNEATGQQETEGRFFYQIHSQLELELDRTLPNMSMLPSIIYFPDGLMEETSLRGFYLKNRKREDQRLQIARSLNGLSYEIRKADEMLLIQNEIF